jgi:hypothetical protein
VKETTFNTQAKTGDNIKMGHGEVVWTGITSLRIETGSGIL